jgi:hypothetical protein
MWPIEKYLVCGIVRLLVVIYLCTITSMDSFLSYNIILDIPEFIIKII